MRSSRTSPCTGRASSASDLNSPLHLSYPIVGVLATFMVSALALAQNEPDMDGSGCVDVLDVAILQGKFGTIARPGESLCDLNTDGFCDLDDYVLMVAVFGGPACVCATDADCADGKSCTNDRCTGVACFHPINCPNQDDGDADCMHQYCDSGGCFSLKEADGSPCSDGSACTDDQCEDGICQSEANDSVCGGLNDTDADCLHGYCGPNGCVQSTEPNGSICFYGSPSLDNDYDADCVGAVCLPVLGGRCSVGNEPAGSPCQDGLSCTFFDSCDGTGHCYAESICGNEDDGDEDCLRGQCDSLGCTLVPEPRYSPCDDGIPCTYNECTSTGLCGVFETRSDDSLCGNQDDSDADCIRGECFGSGCGTEPETDFSACEDGVGCTGSDYCFAGQCYGGIAYDFLCPNQDICDNDCIQYHCDPTQGCVKGFEPERAPCRFLSCGANGCMRDAETTAFAPAGTSRRRTGGARREQAIVCH